jgi:hypothetical protein
MSWGWCGWEAGSAEGSLPGLLGLHSRHDSPPHHAQSVLARAPPRRRREHHRTPHRPSGPATTRPPPGPAKSGPDRAPHRHPQRDRSAPRGPHPARKVIAELAPPGNAPAPPETTTACQTILNVTRSRLGRLSRQDFLTQPGRGPYPKRTQRPLTAVERPSAAVEDMVRDVDAAGTDAELRPYPSRDGGRGGPRS